jgi:hypothetical protein
MPKKEPRIRAALVILPYGQAIAVLSRTLYSIEPGNTPGGKASPSDYYQPVIVQYMKYLYPRGLEKNPDTLLLIM